MALLGLVLIAGERSGVGKTLLGEKLVEALAARGLRVGVVKHVHHGVDYRVKDTGRYLAAGAGRVLAVGPGEYMLVEPRGLDPLEAVKLAARGVDVVVVEGWRGLVSLVAGLGGCTAYITDNGVVLLRFGESVEKRGFWEAVDRLVGAVLAGLCRPRPEILRIND